MMKYLLVFSLYEIFVELILNKNDCFFLFKYMLKRLL